MLHLLCQIADRRASILGAGRKGTNAAMQRSKWRSSTATCLAALFHQKWGSAFLVFVHTIDSLSARGQELSRVLSFSSGVLNFLLKPAAKGAVSLHLLLTRIAVTGSSSRTRHCAWESRPSGKSSRTAIQTRVRLLFSRRHLQH